MGVFSLIKSTSKQIGLFLGIRKVEHTPRTWLRNLHRMGYWELHENYSRYKLPLIELRQVVFPDIEWEDEFKNQKDTDLIRALFDNLQFGYFRVQNVWMLMDNYQIRQTPEVMKAYENLKELDRCHYRTMSHEILMQIPVQLQIILHGQSDHPGWRPPVVCEVDAYEKRTAPLQLN